MSIGGRRQAFGNAQDADGEHVEDAAERRPGPADDRRERDADSFREVGDEPPDLGRDVGVPEGSAEPVVALLQVGGIPRQRAGIRRAGRSGSEVDPD
jgi:hypothetical protein